MTSSSDPFASSADQPQGAPSGTGRIIASRYELLERIGEGGTAEVFRALDQRLDRIVAVKVLRPQFGQDAAARARFAVEARSAAGLSDNNIVPIYDFGAADDGSLFIVMRFVDGTSLRQLLADKEPLPTLAALAIVRQIAEALSEAHARGLIHRDVKPGNILIDAAGVAHLTDFGTVKALSGADNLTRSGMIYGTAAYLAPEQATGAKIGAHTDVYALGVVLYEALTGRPPFVGDDPVAVSYRQAHEPPEPIQFVAPSVDAELGQLIMSCLAKDPVARPASANEVATALASIAERLSRAYDAVQAPAAALVARSAASAGSAGSDASAPSSGADSDDASRDTVIIPIQSDESPTVAGPAYGQLPSPRDSPVDTSRRLPGAAVYPAAIERGTYSARHVPGRRRDDDRDRRAGGVLGGALLVALIGIAALAALAGLVWLMSPRGNGGAIADATRTATQNRPSPTNAVVLPGPTATRPSTGAPTPVQPTLEVTPEPTLEVTAEPTLEITPPPTVEVTPEPTVAVTPTAPPPVGQDVRLHVEDNAFVGDYPDPNGQYHGRTASWVYGQGTGFHTMTASFTVDSPDPTQPASLEIEGLDGENELKNSMRLVLNGTTLYEGPSPFPNDVCCGSSGPGNWGTVAFAVPAGVLAAENTLTVSNLEPTDCTACPKYVMVDYVDVVYRMLP